MNSKIQQNRIQTYHLRSSTPGISILLRPPLVCPPLLPTPPPPDFSKTGGCQDGWYRYRNRCFLYIGLQKQSDRKNFIDAENDCSTKGGHLASVYDDFYNSFISSNLFRGPSKNVWIGLRFNTLNFASWTDEQHITYTNWGPSEPSKQNSGKV